MNIVSAWKLPLIFTGMAMAATAAATPLKIANVSAPAVNCVFNTSCTVGVFDTVSALPVDAGGKGFLQSRIFAGQPGSPAENLSGYAYRIDLSATRSPSAARRCISKLKIPFGTPVSSLDYSGDGAADHVYVVTNGGMGSIGLSSADLDPSGNITFTFSKPVCTGVASRLASKGQSTFFFGLTSPQPDVGAQGALTTEGRTIQAALRAPLKELDDWLESHQNVANAMKWQYRPHSGNDAYAPVDETDKVAWHAWSPSQKADLAKTYVAAANWFAQGAPQSQLPLPDITDMPVNADFNTACGTCSVRQGASNSAMWRLYLAQVAFTLAAEIGQHLPWSIAAYDDLSLRYLLDSSTLARGIGINGGIFVMGTDNSHVPVNRVDNLPQTAFASPFWVYSFLKTNNLIGKTRLETIGLFLDWMRHNLAHFYGEATFDTYEAVWHYRGYAPISRIVSGTVANNTNPPEDRHWTGGCHGSVGLLNTVLRTANVPVQPVWVCGHELAYFTTEKKYLTHGDDPYNRVVRDAASSPVLNLLIDEASYKSLFSSNLSSNVTDSSACGNVGIGASTFH